MEDLLTEFTPTHSKLVSALHEHLTPVVDSNQSRDDGDLTISRPDHVLKVLQSQPDLKPLTKCLKWLTSNITGLNEFDIRLPGAEAAKIINVLVNDIIPHYWHVWTGSESRSYNRQRRLLLQCLTSVAGIGALVTRLRSFNPEPGEAQATIKTRLEQTPKAQLTNDLVNFLETLLDKDSVVDAIWTTDRIDPVISTQKAILWKELVSLLAGGRLLSAVAQAQDRHRSTESIDKQSSWLASGQLYSAWLGRNILFMVIHGKDDFARQHKDTARLLSKALTLGYTDQVVQSVFSSAIAGQRQDLEMLRVLLYDLASHEQKNVLYTVIRLITERDSCITSKYGFVGGLAALIDALVTDKTYLHEALVDWLGAKSMNGLKISIRSRRAVLAALSPHAELVKTALQKLLNDFGDKLYIKHTPVSQQEGNTQALLLVIGHVFMSDPEYVRSLVRTSVYINAISNRLAASSPRSQFFGMAVSSVVSTLVDSPDKRMCFSMDGTFKDEIIQYQQLIKTYDSVGALEELEATVPQIGTPLPERKIKKSQRVMNAKPKAPSAAISKVSTIQEISDDGTSEEDSLPVYNRADFDEEDTEEDEDPTLVQRNRSTAPVYIRDLLAGLNDTDNYDRHRLAILACSTLIRRKAHFGTELSSHLEALATALVGLSDKFTMENFQSLRLQGMIAVLVAAPLKMGQWFSATCFHGEYSMSQRLSILTTLSLGAREIAGYSAEDMALTDATLEPLFPTQKLPEKYHSIYAHDSVAPVTVLASQLERTLIAPMAASAADTLAGPAALRVRTFSSRMAIDAKRKKPLANALATIVADGFFFPLVRLWSVQPRVRGPHNPFTHPALLSHFLKTLALILHAAGASAPALPALTVEFFALLLSLRTSALAAPPVLEALLFGFLTLLELNAQRQQALAEDCARELSETKMWVEGVFERIGGGSEEGQRARGLAAGVLLRVTECGERWEGAMRGELSGFM
ncbi:telomere binding protein [Xylographa opegraphella]|nr:telomere binding protein [Xylographa opegraphella]